jgi:uncharacterized protein YcnI
MTHGRRARALVLTVLAVVAAGTVWSSEASAHVTVAAPGVTVGASDAAITLRVPDESDKASTVGLKVQLPTDHPIAGVLVAAVPGWTATIKTTKLATPIQTDDGEITTVVSEIDWKADSGAGIKPGQFGQFTILAGKLPDGVSTLTFKSIQIYSDGATVSWIEEPAPGSTATPEHPAPTLELAAAPTGSAAASPSASAAGSTPSVAATPAVDTGSHGASTAAATMGIVLGAIGVILGATALAVAFARRRREPTS